MRRYRYLTIALFAGALLSIPTAWADDSADPLNALMMGGTTAAEQLPATLKLAPGKYEIRTVEKGQVIWSQPVEVERKEGVAAGGHDVKSIDALRAIEVLDLPGLREELESAIEDDQKRAEQETQRLKDELGGVDDRLSAIREMVEWSEMWRTNH